LFQIPQPPPISPPRPALYPIKLGFFFFFFKADRLLEKQTKPTGDKLPICLPGAKPKSKPKKPSRTWHLKGTDILKSSNSSKINKEKMQEGTGKGRMEVNANSSWKCGTLTLT